MWYTPTRNDIVVYQTLGRLTITFLSSAMFLLTLEGLALNSTGLLVTGSRTIYENLRAITSKRVRKPPWDTSTMTDAEPHCCWWRYVDVNINAWNLILKYIILMNNYLTFLQHFFVYENCSCIWCVYWNLYILIILLSEFWAYLY